MFLHRLFVASYECGVKLMVLLGEEVCMMVVTPTWLKRAGRTAKEKFLSDRDRAILS